MNPVQKEAHPPKFPRPSSAVAKSRLINRLRFSGPKSNKSYKAPSISVDDLAGIKGFGESHFHDDDNINAQLHFNRQHFNSALYENSKNIELGISQDGLSVSVAKVNFDDTANFRSHASQYDGPQTDVSVTLRDGGMEDVADAIISGTSEFCYLENNPNDPYKFKFTSMPTTKNFSTLSQHGLMTFKDGDCDHVDFPLLIKEQELYAKLMEIPVFGKFRLWKTFYTWRKAHNGTKIHRVVGCCILRYISTWLCCENMHMVTLFLVDVGRVGF